MSKIADAEANATSLDGFACDNALIPTLRNGPKPSWQYLIDGWNVEISEAIDEMNQSRGFRRVGTFASGFTYELPNDVGIDSNGEAWLLTDISALPFTVAAGTVPTDGIYTQVTYNSADSVINDDGTSVQDYIDENPNYFNTVSDLISESLDSGVIARVKGYDTEIRFNSSYTIMTLAEFRQLVGDVAAVPDEECFSFTIGNGNVANLNLLAGTSSPYVYAAQIGVKAGIDSYSKLIKALDFIKVTTNGSGGGTLVLPSEKIETSETLLVKSANNIAHGSVRVIGAGKKNTNIVKSSSATGESTVNAVFHLCSEYEGSSLDFNNSFNIEIAGMTIGDAVSDYGVYNTKYGADIHIHDAFVSGAVTAVSLADIWQSRFERLDLRGVNGFQIRESGTSNTLNSIFVRSTTGVAYELRGNYSFGSNLACDDAEGTAYLCPFGNWEITGVGCESPNITNVFRSGNNGKLTVRNFFVFNLDETNAGLVFARADAGSTLVLDGGTVRSQIDGTEAVMAGTLKSQSSSESSIIISSPIKLADKWGANSEVSVNSSNLLNYMGESKKVTTGLIERAGGQVGFGLDSSSLSSFGPFLDNNEDTPYQRCPMVVTNVKTSPAIRSDGTDVQYARGGSIGDIYLSDSPDVIRAVGWVLVNDDATFVRDGVYKKVPYLDAGITTGRPTLNLSVGQQYFDTTLGKPIWWNGAAWVDATGIAVL